MTETKVGQAFASPERLCILCDTLHRAFEAQGREPGSLGYFSRQGATAASVYVLLTCAFFASPPGHGAGSMVSSTVPVKVVRFDRDGDRYTLVVRPARTNPPDPYMGTCERFEVRGMFGELRGADGDTEPGLTKAAHREAMKFLNEAFVSGQVIDLGWMGTGFVPVEASNPCVVKSRALKLVQDGLGSHVLSYHDAGAAR